MSESKYLTKIKTKMSFFACHTFGYFFEFQICLSDVVITGFFFFSNRLFKLPARGGRRKKRRRSQETRSQQTIRGTQLDGRNNNTPSLYQLYYYPLSAKRHITT